MACYFFSDLINRSYIDDNSSSSNFFLIETLIDMIRKELEHDKKYTLEALKKSLKTYYVPLKSYGLYLQKCGNETEDCYKKSEYIYNSQILIDQSEYLKRVIDIIEDEPLEIKNKLEISSNKIAEIRQTIKNRQSLTDKINKNILEFKELKNRLIVNTYWMS